jgi:type IV pilus assembly protein PilB
VSQFFLATPEQIRAAIAEHSEVKSVDLSNLTVPPAVLAMVPKPIARENAVIPIGEEKGVLRIATSNPSDFETIAKLQFILGRDILLAVAPEEQILAAIDRHYGRP